MAEYIERGRLKEAISADCQHLFSFDASFYDMVMIDIDEVSAADVAPVVHARWIYGEDVDIQCSACGADALTEGDYRQIKSRYCPNCGAKMDLED